MHMKRVTLAEGVLDANDTIAKANREDFDRAGVTVVNLMSAPGAGKTTLLERVLERFEATRPDIRVGVLEGDVRTTFDADRLARFDRVPVTQINTDPGFGGECHLDANMVRSALPRMPLEELDLLLVENVGNLVCPAEFRIGEDARVMVTAITEGEDKPLKYPLMFRACDLVLLNKIDLLEAVEADLEQLRRNVEDVHPDVRMIEISARTGAGTEEVHRWLNDIVRPAGAAA